MTAATDAFSAGLPKAELHLHIEDAALLSRLAADRICLTVCPVSNGWVTDSMKVRELGAMLDKTLLATVNSDGP